VRINLVDNKIFLGYKRNHKIEIQGLDHGYYLGDIFRDACFFKWDSWPIHSVHRGLFFIPKGHTRLFIE
jgi:hypothetical protein